MKFSKKIIALLAVGSCGWLPASFAQEGFWTGYLPYNLYSDPDGCVESAIIGSGATTSLAVLEPGTLCETDLFFMPDPTPVYTKMVIDSCGESKGDGMPVAAGYLTAYSCADPDCSQCNEEAELMAYTTAAGLAPIVDVDGCFVWTTTAITNQTDTSWVDIVQSATQQSQMFIPNATQSETTMYWDVLLDNTCLGAELEMANEEIQNEEVEQEAEGDSPTSEGNALVPGLFVAISIIVAIA